MQAIASHTFMVQTSLLQAIASHTFMGLERIQTLHLERNRITSMATAAFGAMTSSLTYLKLDDNTLDCRRFNIDGPVTKGTVTKGPVASGPALEALVVKAWQCKCRRAVNTTATKPAVIGAGDKYAPITSKDGRRLVCIDPRAVPAFDSHLDLGRAPYVLYVALNILTQYPLRPFQAPSRSANSTTASSQVYCFII